jgi:hypothetical protein
MPGGVRPAFVRMARRRKDGPPDEVIELVGLPDTEAQIVASRLRDEGIDAQVFAAGASGDAEFGDGAVI